MAKALMVQGTGSHVGKSVIVAALCRILKRRGVKVAPFKAQNMALNSFITPEGGEIGRAQAYQADAAGIPPSVLMNPVLLKANSDTGAQVIVRGKVVGNMGVRQYHAYKDEAFRAVEDCYRELSESFDVIVMEGAGSPAEINLKASDIVNMKAAKMAGAKVLIAADIDKGGVFASILGTMEILDPDERDMVAGFLINKFRGDASLLKDGLDFVLARTGKPVLGVIPHFTGIHLQEEDGVALDGHVDSGDGAIDIAVLRLGHISNFTDFDPFAAEPGVRLRYVRGVSDFGRPDLLIIPGTKNTVADLLELRGSGLERKTLEYLDRGGTVIGICGGYQMLGRGISDPHGVETDKGRVDGMGVLDVETTLYPDKVTTQVRAAFIADASLGELTGYEIHMGRTALGGGARPVFSVRSGPDGPHDDGAMNAEGSSWGTYLHGVFENDRLRRSILDSLRASRGLDAQVASTDYGVIKEEGLERLADLVEANIDMRTILSLV
ncbi:MAG: cobyric acid synthase [Nitrospirae bacterium]|nr:cobyric acid synthase [Nitrospirota bacterium]